MKNIEKHWDEITEIHNAKEWSLECCIRSLIDSPEECTTGDCKDCWEKVHQWILEEAE